MLAPLLCKHGTRPRFDPEIMCSSPRTVRGWVFTVAGPAQGVEDSGPCRGWRPWHERYANAFHMAAPVLAANGRDRLNAYAARVLGRSPGSRDMGPKRN